MDKLHPPKTVNKEKWIDRKFVKNNLKNNKAPFEGVKIKVYQMTCEFCPSQWDFYSVDGQYFYGRYRHGHFSIETQIDKKDIILYDYDDGTDDGWMTDQEMFAKTGFKLSKEG